jgi:hypothetical protein
MPDHGSTRHRLIDVSSQTTVKSIKVIVELSDRALSSFLLTMLLSKKLEMRSNNHGFCTGYCALIRAALASALIGALGLGTGSALASGRSAALANDFKFFCMRGKPCYEGLDAYANALKLQTKKDLSRDLGNGNRVRSKSWIVGDDIGAYELVAADAVNGNVLVESCGIGSADGAGEEMRAELTAHSDLGTAQESTSPDGRVKTVVWTRV